MQTPLQVNSPCVKLHRTTPRHHCICGKPLRFVVGALHCDTCVFSENFSLFGFHHQLCWFTISIICVPVGLAISVLVLATTTRIFGPTLNTFRTKMSSSDAEIKQFKDFILNYNKLSEMCFMDCVHDFTFREVSKKELSCSENCFDKFVKLNNRISQRFQEIQLSQHDKLQQQQAQM